MCLLPVAKDNGCSYCFMISLLKLVAGWIYFVMYLTVKTSGTIQWLICSICQKSDIVHLLQKVFGTCNEAMIYVAMLTWIIRQSCIVVNLLWVCTGFHVYGQQIVETVRYVDIVCFVPVDSCWWRICMVVCTIADCWWQHST